MREMTKKVAWSVMVAAMVLGSGAGLMAVQPVEEPQYQIGEMRQQVLAGTKYVYLRHETSFMEMGPVIGPAIEKTLAAAGQGKFGSAAGAVTFQYRGMTMDPAAKFTLDIGVPVGPEAKAAEGFEMVELPPFRCASVVYSGPTSGIPQAYQKLMEEMAAAGLTPTGVNRESYLYWESMDSRNNIVHIAMGVQ
jgi:effector-binding domain-containing protein